MLVRFDAWAALSVRTTLELDLQHLFERSLERFESPEKSERESAVREACLLQREALEMQLGRFGFFVYGTDAPL